MQSPSKNISRSLAGQRKPARGEEQITVSGMAGRPSMIVPGEGMVQEAPGTGRLQNGEGERSASRYTGPMRRHGGG